MEVDSGSGIGGASSSSNANTSSASTGGKKKPLTTAEIVDSLFKDGGKSVIPVDHILAALRISDAKARESATWREAKAHLKKNYQACKKGGVFSFSKKDA